MRLSVFRENESVLLVGEGNFSFATSLVKHNLKIAIIASCYESSVTRPFARRNIEFLENRGIRTVLGVDATRLDDNPAIGDEKFDKIVFNFPHVGGKMRIEKNRELLMKFFVSAAKSLNIGGQVLVTLCDGQGGTSADRRRRRWDDSWKVSEMAAHGDFVLSRVEPFCVSNFGDYSSTGYRSLDKEFNVDKSLTHFFERPSSLNFAPKDKLDLSKSRTEFDGKIAYRDMFPTVSAVSEPFCLYNFQITFSVGPNFSEIEFYTILYNFVGRIVRNVDFVRSYEFPGSKKVTRTYGISYGSNDFPLYRERTVDIHQNVVAEILEDNMNVIVTR